MKKIATDICKSITYKINWQNKISNPDITTKWWKEISQQNSIVSYDDFELALKLLKELKEYQECVECEAECGFRCHNDCENDCEYDCICSHKECCQCEDIMKVKESKHSNLNPAGVIQIDNMIDIELGNKFKKNIKILEDSNDKDWHPGSNGQVLDLIHQSLFCYVKGRSELLSNVSINNYNCQKKIRKSKKSKKLKMEDRSWLPEYCDIDILNDEESKYQWLPSEFRVDREEEDVKVNVESYINNLDKMKYEELYEIIAKIFSKFVPLFDKILDERLNGNIQVIVKASNIILTPSNPKYAGGVWHLEGMPYENIVGTGIYYYDIDNITESYLEFRKAIEDVIYYPQNSVEYVSKHHGLWNEAPLNEYMGKLEAKTEKCIVFPNIMQHRVAPFELRDKSKMGYRRILVFFLIDPNNRIISTKDVPIQQETIMREYMNDVLKDIMYKNMIENILNKMNLMTLDEAKKHRERLMYYRKYYVDEINSQIYERPFSLCEH